MIMDPITVYRIGCELCDFLLLDVTTLYIYKYYY